MMIAVLGHWPFPIALVEAMARLAFVGVIAGLTGVILASLWKLMGVSK